MYEFHYKHIGTKYDISTKLLFTDTGSLVCEIETDDVYEDFYEHKNLFDSSDYPKDSKFFGKMKDEVKGKIISEFVGLKSKMYSLVIVNNEEIEKQ